MKQIFFALFFALIFSLSGFAQTESQTCAKSDDPKIVEPGTPMKFVATVAGDTSKMTLGYEWRVSAGTIASGQGTCRITVDTTGLPSGTNITAEVTVNGLPPHCPNTASETGSVIMQRPMGDALDSFGKLSNDEVKARVDALFIALGNEPNAQAYIINYGTDAEIAAREKQILSAVRFRKYDARRITFLRGGANPNGAGVFTRFWIVPPGAQPPKP